MRSLGPIAPSHGRARAIVKQLSGAEPKDELETMTVRVVKSNRADWMGRWRIEQPIGQQQQRKSLLQVTIHERECPDLLLLCLCVQFTDQL